MSERFSYPLSSGQQALWFLHRLSPDHAAYTIAGAGRVRSPLDPAVLARALGRLVARHPALRTRFRAVEPHPVQEVREEPSFDFTVADSPAPLETARAFAFRPFELERGPLLRAGVFRTADREETVLVLAVHHIVSDFWSLGLMLRELGAFYRAESEGTAPGLPSFPGSYTDWVERQADLLAGETGERLETGWRQALAGVPFTLELPADRPRPAVQTYEGASIPVRLPAALAGDLRRLGRRSGATPAVTLLAAFQAVLHKLTGQPRLLVGMPTTGRRDPRVAGLVGYFVNPVPIVGDFSGDPSFAEALGRVRAAAQAAFDRQDYPFARLVERLQPDPDPSRSPLMQAMFVLQKGRWTADPGMAALSVGGTGAVLELGPLRFESLPFATESSQMDLGLTLAEIDGGIAGRWSFNPRLFDAATIRRWAEHFTRLLAAAVAEPLAPLAGLPWLRPAESHQLLYDWGTSTVETPAQLSLHALVATCAAGWPDRAALCLEDAVLSYGELVARADRLARELLRLGARPEARVALCAERSFELVAGALAVFQTGGVYLPLDPSFPPDRLGSLLQDATPVALLVHSATAGLCASFGLPQLRLERHAEPVAGPAPVPDLVLPENSAYMIYTSGSTGRPKGVSISHRAVTTRIQYGAVHDLEPGAWFLQKASISFDASILELFLPLVYGGTVVITTPGSQHDIPYLLSEVRRRQVTNTVFPPSALAILVEQGGLRDCPSLRQLGCGGETLPAELVSRFLALHDCELINLYGPTEATVTVARWKCRADGQRPAIGRPVGGARLHLLDRTGRPVPPGVTGELYIGGPILARGYWQDPRQTAERFVPDPFGRESGGGRLYRTGDLARWRTDGSLDFLGRRDEQVKVRGFRVELGEIEALLGEHPEIQEAAVVAVGAEADRRLVAYLVPRLGTELDPADLREMLASRLPSFMVPSAFVSLDRLPLTPTAKVDRQALSRRPAPRDAGDEAAFRPPRTATEARLAEIFARLLDRPRVGAEDSFFALGGHSLLATRLVSRIERELAVSLPLRTVFESPTVAALAAEIDRLERTTCLPLLRQHRREAPLSWAQERLWFLEQLSPGTAAYHLPGAVGLRGSLHRAALAAALGEIVRRHEALRTVLAPGPAGATVQRILPGRRHPLPVVDLARLPAPAAESSRLAAREAGRLFDLEQGPVLRTTLLALAPEEHVFLLTLHHVAADGWSIGVLLEELSVLYASALEGRPSPLAELPVQYADFAVWQRAQLAGPALEAEISWWRQRLAGAPEVLELPTDRPRPPAASLSGGMRPFSWGGALGRAVDGLAGRSGATRFLVLLAAFQALLARWTGESDVVVGAPVAGRDRAELEGLIGFFVNTLIFRGQVSADGSFAGFLAAVRDGALETYAHQGLPFEKLVEALAPKRDVGNTPIFQVLLAMQPGGRAALPGLELSALPLTEDAAGTAKFDLTLAVDERGESLRGFVEYRTALFDAASIARWERHLQTFLAAGVAGPERPLSSLPLLDTAERHQVEGEWNDTAESLPDGSSFPARFARTVASRPDAVALVGSGESLSYAELDRFSDRLSQALLRRGTGLETRVGVGFEDAVLRMVAVLAVFKTGAAWVPLDPADPAERLAFYREDAEIALVLTEDRLQSVFGADPTVLGLETLERETGDPPPLPVLAPHPESLAYLIYTSGSTGLPKAVAVQQRGLPHLLRSQEHLFDLGPDEHLLQFAALSFDVSVWDLLLAWTSGSQLHVASREGKLPGPALAALLAEREITFATLTPSTLAAVPQQRFPALRRLIVAGEACPPELAERWSSSLAPGRPPERRFWNLYGPTEITVCVTADLYSPGSRRITLGRPFVNRRLHLLDRSGSPVPVGWPGELWIGGAGVSRGYFGRPDRTAERFLPDPFATGEPGARLYRTGDLGRWRTDGSLEFLGRTDHQIKIRGIRIELGEIEARLAELPEIGEAAVVLGRSPDGEPFLTAFLVAQPGAPEIPGRELRECLQRHLPAPMIPSSFLFLSDLPRSAAGKVDRRALSRQAENGTAGCREGRPPVAPRTEVERQLAEIWAEVLGIPLDRVGVHDDFFDLGGHSLRSTQVLVRIRESFGIELPVRRLFESPTVETLALAVAEALFEGVSPEEREELLLALSGA